MKQEVTKQRRIGLLGGTFDPVHNGHLAVANHVLSVLALDAMWFIPAASPPHKLKHADNQPISGFQDRVAMLDKVLTLSDKFQLCLIEAERTSLSYSIDTLRELQKRVGADIEFFFILGADAFAEIDTWKRYAELPGFAHLVIISRADNRPGIVEQMIRKCFPNFQPASDSNAWSAKDQKRSLIQLVMEPVPISSTMVREMVRKNYDVSGLVPPGVGEYIQSKKLYRPDVLNTL